MKTKVELEPMKEMPAVELVETNTTTTAVKLPTRAARMLIKKEADRIICGENFCERT